MLDVEALAEATADIVREQIERELAPIKAENVALAARCKALEEAATNAPEIDLTGVQKLIEAEIAKLPTPEPPKEIDREELQTMVSEAVAALPAPEKGEPGEDGKSVALEDVLPIIASEVEKAVSSIPVPRDGKDAAGIVAPVKDNGELCFTLEDGRLLRTGIRDGEKGADGKDGFSLDDFDMEPGEDGRTYTLKFVRGETVHKFELTFPCPVYCGVWKEGETYVPGDLVTWGGSTWHCNQTDPGKPDTKDSGWQLMVKKGRDGKDAKPNG